jgi:hypothetical protein
MTQVGESVAVVMGGAGSEKCIFCNKDHQEESPAPSATFSRNMTTLKKEGRAYSVANYSAYYPGQDLPPLAEWSSDITKTGGYKSAAHHCIALKTASSHKLSGEFKEAGYDPNRGSNCCWLPYSQVQFSRARAYAKPLQKHRGGHTGAYFEKVEEHLDKVAKLVEQESCLVNEVPSKEDILMYLLLQEKAIWRGLITASMSAYHLYNTSYLNPMAPWGSFDSEKGKTPSDVIGTPDPADDDNAADNDSKDDPE